MGRKTQAIWANEVRNSLIIFTFSSGFVHHSDSRLSPFLKYKTNNLGISEWQFWKKWVLHSEMIQQFLVYFHPKIFHIWWIWTKEFWWNKYSPNHTELSRQGCLRFVCVRRHVCDFWKFGCLCLRRVCPGPKKALSMSVACLQFEKIVVSVSVTCLR